LPVARPAGEKLIEANLYIASAAAIDSSAPLAKF
jgi:hypothetical protein